MAVVLFNRCCTLKLLHSQKSMLKLAAVSLSTSCVLHLDQKWRRAQKLTMNPNACGKLTDKPDYSYLDGRPAEIGLGVKRRLEKQKKYAEKILELSKEIDFAVDRHKILMQEEEEERQKKLDSKLKPKGDLLLTPK